MLFTNVNRTSDKINAKNYVLYVETTESQNWITLAYSNCLKK